MLLSVMVVVDLWNQVHVARERVCRMNVCLFVCFVHPDSIMDDDLDVACHVEVYASASVT